MSRKAEALPDIYPFSDEQIARVAKSEPTLRDMLQQFRHLFDHMVLDDGGTMERTGYGYGVIMSLERFYSKLRNAGITHSEADRQRLQKAYEFTVDYATRDDTAKAGADYSAQSGTITFEIGERTKTISIPILTALVCRSE